VAEKSFKYLRIVADMPFNALTCTVTPIFDAPL